MPACALLAPDLHAACCNSMMPHYHTRPACVVLLAAPPARCNTDVPHHHTWPVCVAQTSTCPQAQAALHSQRHRRPAVGQQHAPLAAHGRHVGPAAPAAPGLLWPTHAAPPAPCQVGHCYARDMHDTSQTRCGATTCVPRSAWPPCGPCCASCAWPALDSSCSCTSCMPGGTLFACDLHDTVRRLQQFRVQHAPLAAHGRHVGPAAPATLGLLWPPHAAAPAACQVGHCFACDVDAIVHLLHQVCMHMAATWALLHQLRLASSCSCTSCMPGGTMFACDLHD